MNTDPSSAYSIPSPRSQATVVSSRFCDVTGARPGVEQAEAARAVGDLDRAGLEAGLAEQSGLLVAEHAAHRHGPAEDVRRCLAEARGRGHDLGQHRRGHPEGRAEVGVPAALRDVEEHRARGVRRVAQVPAGEVEDEPRVDGAERHLAPHRPGGQVGIRARGTTRSWCPRSTGRAAGPCAVPRAARARRPRACRQRSVVRRSCQTMAGPSGSPVFRSQNTAVSRWLAMPIAAILPMPTPEASSASRAAVTCVLQISRGSCSTQPGRG